jgi:hypothetical protein
MIEVGAVGTGRPIAASIAIAANLDRANMHPR